MKRFKTIVSVLLAVTLLLGGSVMPTFALRTDDSVAAWAADEHPEEPIATTGDLQLPAAYDLRSEGVVTPVKNQGAWNTCWSFGSIAAAETSILSSEGKTYEETGLDLSERHLAYFSQDHVTEDIDPDQAGEGVYILGEEDKPNLRMSSGGWTILATSLLSQGVGPVPENLYPYRGVNESGGSTYDAENGYYSPYDDWSIPDMNEEYGIPNRSLTWNYMLKDGNVLPKYWADGDEEKISYPAGADAIKTELLNGCGVTMAYNASDKYMNSSEEKGIGFASYCSEKYGATHEVCIVGWDDSYSASNFTHTEDIYGNPFSNQWGTPYSEEEALAMTTPPGDGAWIVKNSWGSETDWVEDDLGNVINKSNFGIKNEDGLATGYFYLSYYDKSIESAETMIFTSNDGWGDEFDTYQYDYMPAIEGLYTDTDEKQMSSANVFVAEDAGELRSISTSTPKENMRLTFAIFLLNDDAEAPTDGELAYHTSLDYEFSGFHRVDLSKAIALEEGQRFSIVSTCSSVNQQGAREYSISVNKGMSEAVSQQRRVNRFTKAVVNEGESYLFRDGEWTDWSEYIENILIDPHDMYITISRRLIDICPLDNFSIKAYVVPTGEEEPLILGDADGDGKVTVLDATVIQRHLAEMSTESYVEEASDADGDGEVTILDATAIQRFLAELPTNEDIGKPIESPA